MLVITSRKFFLPLMLPVLQLVPPCIDLQFPSPVGSNTQNYPVFWILPYLVSDSEDNRPNIICNNTRDATIIPSLKVITVANHGFFSSKKTYHPFVNGGDLIGNLMVVGKTRIRADVHNNSFIVGMNSCYSCYPQPNLTRPC